MATSAQDARVALGRRLREIRLGANLTGRHIADQHGWHCSKIPKIEAGKQVPSPGDIRAWCRTCNAQALEDDLIASLHVADSLYQEWRQRERISLKRRNQTRATLAEQTNQFRIYESGVIPGLLQTRAYTTAVLQMVVALRGSDEDITGTVDVRMQRQQVLRRAKHRFHFVMEEAVLYYRISDQHTRIEQLEHLLEVSRRPTVRLGVIGQTIQRSLWPAESFYMHDDRHVSSELVSALLTVTRPTEIREYVKTFALLADMAVYGNAARGLITNALESIKD